MFNVTQHCTIFQLSHQVQMGLYYWWRKRTTDRLQVTDKRYHIMSYKLHLNAYWHRNHSISDRNALIAKVEVEDVYDCGRDDVVLLNFSMNIQFLIISFISIKVCHAWDFFC